MNLLRVSGWMGLKNLTLLRCFYRLVFDKSIFIVVLLYEVYFHFSFGIHLSFQVEINHAAEIDEIFDAISYRKGASVIRMLQSFLGAKPFQVYINYLIL